MLELEYLLDQFVIEVSQLTGPFLDPLLKLLIQTLNFCLGLFVPCGFDNVPIAAPFGYCKLMCSHDVENFPSSTQIEGICAQDGQALIGDSVIEGFFVFTEVLPVLLFEPGSIARHSYAGIALGRCARELL